VAGADDAADEVYDKMLRPFRHGSRRIRMVEFRHVAGKNFGYLRQLPVLRPRIGLPLPGSARSSSADAYRANIILLGRSYRALMIRRFRAITPRYGFPIRVLFEVMA
jgi:hypothetical protein